MPIKPVLDNTLTEPCRPLPALTIPTGQDLRPYVLANRAQSDLVLAECSGKHQAVLKAVQ